MSVIMVYDLETIPDIVSGRRLLGLSKEVEDREVALKLIERRNLQTQGNSSFLPHYLQQIVCISVVLASSDGIKVWSLGDLESPESELITRFFEGVQKYTPTLVSWNGSGFDLPVLHYRALLHKVVAARYWEIGEQDSGFKWNNYLSRYHQRHIDMMDVLANYQNRSFAPLDELSVILGFPGKMGMHGSEVFEQYLNGELPDIRHYCETDVLNTYLIYLRFQRVRGILTEKQYEQAEENLKIYLEETQKPHFLAFLKTWGQVDNGI